MQAGIVLFTRDLRVHDNPALHAACEECERVVPLFVLDDAILETFGAPNRVAFLLDCAARSRCVAGERSVARSWCGVVTSPSEVARVGGIGAVLSIAEDVSAYARGASGDSATRGSTFAASPGVTVIPPGELTPSGGGDHFAVFTPYWRRWRAQPRRALLEPAAAISPARDSIGPRARARRARRREHSRRAFPGR